MESNLLQPENNNNNSAGKLGSNAKPAKSKGFHLGLLKVFAVLPDFVRPTLLFMSVTGSSRKPQTEKLSKNFTWPANCIAKSSSKMHDSQFGCGLPKPI